MKSPSHRTRRQFVGEMAVSAAAMAALPASVLANGKTAKPKYPICCFAKPLQHLPFDQLADKMAELGFQGIEATVRKGGQVEPARVEEDLPKLVEALKKRSLEVTIMASDVNRVDQPLTQRVLKTAARLGIPRYRLLAYRYDLRQPVAGQLADLQPAVAELAALNGELGIQGIYQNHSGSHYVGAPVWDIYNLIQDLPADQFGIAFDIRHATVEGGLSWPIEFNLVQPHLAMVYVKDFQWQGRVPKNVPLGTGMIDPRFFKMLRQTSFSGPVSLHMEYLDHRDPDLGEQRVTAVTNDMKTLQRLLPDG